MVDIQKKSRGDRTTVTFGGELTVRYVQEMKKALLDAVQTSTSIEVVLGTIDRVDSSFPQLLCSAHRVAEALHKRLTVSGTEQERFTDMLHRSGFIRQTGSRDTGRATYLWLYGPVSK